VPIPISNPTIGTGLAVSLLYLHPQKTGDNTGRTTTSGLLGMYTSTDSWATGVFHEGFYWNDRLRLRGGLVYGDFNLKFYGIGNDAFLRDNPLDYNAKSIIFSPRLLYRLPWENWYLGPRYFFIKIDNTFDLSGLVPQLPEVQLDSQTGGLGLVTLYDTRDNNFWPSAGNFFELTATKYGEQLGGDFDYNKFILKYSHYFPLKTALTLGLRLDGQFIDGRAPFYDLSQLNLRGLPKGLFADRQAVTAQGEVRWNFYKKWTALGFLGGGRIAENISDLGSSPTQPAGGIGLRYLIAGKQKLKLGIDVAYGNDEVSFYVVVGDWLAN
jgi:hypothetical protein